MQRPNIRLKLLIVAVLPLCACGSTRDKSATDSEGLSSAFKVFEQRRSEEKMHTPAGGLVDYDSKIVVRPDRLRIAQAIGPAPDATKPPDAQALARIERLEALQAKLDGIGPLEETLRLLTDFERQTLEFASDFADYVNRNSGLLRDDPRWQSLNKTEQELVDELRSVAKTFVGLSMFEGDRPDLRHRQLELQSLQEAVDQNELAALGEVSDEFNAEVTRVFARIAPTPENPVPEDEDNPVPEDEESAQPVEQEVPFFDRFERREIVKLVNDTTALLREQIEALEAAVLKDAPEAELQIEAYLRRGGTSLPVTMEPYFRVEGTERGNKSPRVGLPSESDLERLRREFEAYNQLADSINELAKIARDDEKLKALRTSLLKALETFAKDLLEGFEKDLKAALQDPAFQPVHAQLEALKGEIEALDKAVEELLGKSTDPVAFTTRAIALLNRLRGDNGLRGQLEQLATALQELQLAGPLSALRDSLRETVQRELDALLAVLRDKPVTASAAGFFAALRQLAELSEVSAFAGLKAGRIERQPLALGEARNGVVDLARTQAEPNDELEIRYRVSTKGPDAKGEELTLTHESSQLFDVRKFGWYTTLKGQILFYDRLRDGISTFRAAPGVCLNLHYRPEIRPAFFDAVAPGLGLSVSSPSFEDGTELAIGLQFTAFNDFLQVGYAYDISVEDEPWMFFFGLDLIQVFQTMQ